MPDSGAVRTTAGAQHVPHERLVPDRFQPLGRKVIAKVVMQVVARDGVRRLDLREAPVVGADEQYGRASAARLDTRKQRDQVREETGLVENEPETPLRTATGDEPPHEVGRAHGLVFGAFKIDVDGLHGRCRGFDRRQRGPEKLRFPRGAEAGQDTNGAQGPWL